MLWIITTCLLTFTIRWVGFFFCLWLQWRNIREQKDLIKKRKVCVCIWGGGHCCNSFQTNFHLKWTEIFLHHSISWKDGFRQKMLILLIQGWSSEGFPAGRRLVSQVISPLTTQQHHWGNKCKLFKVKLLTSYSIRFRSEREEERVETVAYRVTTSVKHRSNKQ